LTQHRHPLGWVNDPAYVWSENSDDTLRCVPMQYTAAHRDHLRMRTYIRNRVPGGTYFFTVNLACRSGNTLLIEHIELLRKAYRATRIERPFETIAAVILPEHLHVIWRLPADDDDYPTRWRMLKSRFSHSIANTEIVKRSRALKCERGIWQRRYWEHTIQDNADLYRHIDYIHYNPVKHGWCETPVEWPFSTMRRYVERGLLSPDWGCP
jgi:putative transposase